MKKKNIDNPETNEIVDDNDIQKSLDENLEIVQDLIKSDSEEDVINELVKSAAGRKKMKKMLDDYSDDEEDEDEDEGENEEEEGKNKKMKKSFDDVIEDNEDVIDAVPVLKSFSKVLEKSINVLSEISSEVSDLKKSQEKIQNLQKSMGEVLVGSTELIKSFSNEVEEIANAPQEVKGAISDFEILNKSFGESKVESKVSVKVLSESLQKSFQEGKVSSLDISKWELSGYNPNALSKEAYKEASKHFPQEVN